MGAYFFSYARADQAVALPFAEALKAAGVALWVDQHDIRPSEHWDSAVEAALRASDGVVIILSPRSAASANVADEVSVAVDARKHLIPVMIERCTPPLRLTRVQFIDATADREAALARCLAAIRGGAVAAPDLGGASPALLAEAALVRAEQALSPRIGPIAGAMVRRAAASAASLEALHADLAAKLPEKERAAFLAAVGQAPAADAPSPAPPPKPAAIAPEAAAALAAALTPHLGPIASALVAREQAGAGSREELRQRLAARIPAGRERSAFLKATE